MNYDVLEIVQSSRFKEFPILGMEGKGALSLKAAPGGALIVFPGWALSYP